MTYSIIKEFAFEAAHSLPYLPEGHKCRNLHGHSYRVRLELTATELDERSFVVDFADLQSFGDYVNGLDHQNLNDLFDFNTTSENLAAHLFNVACIKIGDAVSCVSVSETAKTWASVRG